MSCVSLYSFVVNGADFIYMNTSLYGNGTSFVESLFEEFGKFFMFKITGAPYFDSCNLTFSYLNSQST